MSRVSTKRSMQYHRISLKKHLQNTWRLYVLLLIPLTFLLVFAYIPMYGTLLAFKESYNVRLGIWNSPWASSFGFSNFIRFFNNYNFWECLKNTLTLSVYSLLASFPCSILLALGLNYVLNTKFKKAVQLISYSPYFISTIVLVGMLNAMLNTKNGALGNFIYQILGINLLAEATWFPSLYVWSGIWQGVGFGAIIYIASLSGVDIQLHEAAISDGATILQRIWHIDLPAIMPTAVIMLILNMGSILNVGYEKILAMQNPNNLRTSEVISTYSYKVALVSTIPDFTYSTAISLFQSLIGLLLILVVNKIVNKVSGDGLW